MDGSRLGLTVNGIHLTLIDDDHAVLSINDASAEEGDDLNFEVTLDKAVPGGLTVTPTFTHGTADSGDYTPNTATLRFDGTGRETKTISLSTIEDTQVEGDETFTLHIEVSGTPHSVAADGTGTGTIIDDDLDTAERLLRIHEPILADVSLAMTESVVDAASGRMQQTDHAPSRRFNYRGAGRYMDVSGAPGVIASRNGDFGQSPSPRGVDLSHGGEPGAMMPQSGQARISQDGSGASRDPHSLSFRQMLGTMSFEYSLLDPEDRKDAAGSTTIWGQGDLRSLGGSHDYGDSSESVSWNGDVLGLLIGVDRRFRSGLLVGLAASRFDSEMDYKAHDAEGRFEGVYKTSMTSAHPYANWAATPRLDLWAAGGYGQGEILFDEQRLGIQKADSDWLSGAAGGELLLTDLKELLAGGETSLDLKADAFATRLEARDNGKLVQDLSVRAHRLRLAVVGEHRRVLASGASFAPALEIGARRDGGAGETGIGLEISTRLRYESASGRLSVELRAHRLAVFDGGKEEWGFGGMMHLAPDAHGRGFSLSLRPSYGAHGSGAEGMWRGRPTGRGVGMLPSGSLDGEFGYGLPWSGESALLTLVSGFSMHAEGGMRQSLGTLLECAGLRLRFDLARSPTPEGREYGIKLQFAKQFGPERQARPPSPPQPTANDSFNR